MNFCKAFAEVVFGSKDAPPTSGFVPPVTIICDNCTDVTLEMVRSTGLPHVNTHEGNAGSLIFAIRHALDKCDDDDIVYFCEDDYLHLGSAPDLLCEGMACSEYVSLYDHPDKYTSYYEGGEVSKVIKTQSSHWRSTISTCMTFGTRVKTLREDAATWEKFTSSVIPRDHEIFLELREKGRGLLVPIPGVACHVDLALSIKLGYMVIEPWAIELMIEHFEHRIQQEVRANPLRAEEYVELYRKVVGNRTGREKLMALEMLARQFLK